MGSILGESNYRSKSMVILEGFPLNKRGVHEFWVGVIQWRWIYQEITPWNWKFGLVSYFISTQGVIMALLTKLPPTRYKALLRTYERNLLVPLIRPAIKKPEFFCGVPWGSTSFFRGRSTYWCQCVELYSGDECLRKDGTVATKCVPTGRVRTPQGVAKMLGEEKWHF